MTYPAIGATDYSNIYPATIVAAYIRPDGEKWQTLGSIEDSSLEIESFTKPDTKKRDTFQGASKFTAKVNMMQTSQYELGTLPLLCDGTNDFLFKLIDAESIPSGSAATTGWFYISAEQVKAVHAKAVLSGDESSGGRIELDFQGAIAAADLDACVKAVIDAADFESSSDANTFHSLGVYSAAMDGGNPAINNIQYGGVSSITEADAAGGGAQTINPIFDPKIEFDFPVYKEGIRQYPLNTVDIAIDLSWGETDSTNLLLLDSIDPLRVNVVINMTNGLIITLNGITGNKTHFKNIGTMDKPRVTGLIHNGSILRSDYNGILGHV